MRVWQEVLPAHPGMWVKSHSLPCTTDSISFCYSSLYYRHSVDLNIFNLRICQIVEFSEKLIYLNVSQNLTKYFLFIFSTLY